MLDERLLADENRELMGEEVYDILEIFDSVELATKHFATLYGMPEREVEDMWEEYPRFDKSNQFAGSLTSPNNPRLEYCWFTTGRVVLVKFY